MVCCVYYELLPYLSIALLVIAGAVISPSCRNALKKELSVFSPGKLLLSFYLSFVLVQGEVLYQRGDLTSIAYPVQLLLILLLTAVTYPLLGSAIALLDIVKETSFCKPGTQRAARHFLLFSLLFFVSFIPALIIRYPGIVTADSAIQWYMLDGTMPLTNHHPVIHTFLIWVCRKIGYAVPFLAGSAAGSAVLIYSLLQAAVLSLLLGSVFSFFYRSGTNRNLLILAYLLWAVFPQNGIYAVYMTKDTLFSAFVFYACFLLWRIAESDGAILKDSGFLFLFGLMTCLIIWFRGNGIMVVALYMAALLIVCFRHHKKEVLILFLVMVIAVVGHSLVLRFLQIPKTELAEALGQPINQIGYVVARDKELSAEETEKINAVIDSELVKRVYDPYYSDGIKFADFHEDVIRENPIEYLRLYAGIARKHPATCYVAAANLCIGYWYPCVKKGIVAMDPGDEDRFLPHIGVYRYSRSHLLDRYLYGDVRNSVFESFLWSIGNAVFAMLFLLVAICRARKKLLLSFLPCLAVWLSLLVFSPAFCETRYIYSVFLALPFYFLAFFTSLRFRNESVGTDQNVR